MTTDGPPPDATACWEDDCNRPPTHERLTGISMGAPDSDGMPDPDGFSWCVEWVCARHRTQR